MKTSKYQVLSVDKKPPVAYDIYINSGRCFFLEFINKGKKDGEIILSDGKNEASFEFLEMYVLDGSEYAVLLEEGDSMVTIMRFEEGKSSEPEKFYTVDDDEIFAELSELYENDTED